MKRFFLTPEYPHSSGFFPLRKVDLYNALMKNKVNERRRRRESRERDMERQWKDKARQGDKTNTDIKTSRGLERLTNFKKDGR